MLARKDPRAHEGDKQCAAGCGRSFKRHRWGNIQAHNEGWFEQKDGTAYCPDHVPDWVAGWRRRPLSTEDIPMDSSERCPLTELIKSQCAHCRRRPHAPMFMEAPPPEPTPAFGWACAACETPFEEGDEIFRTAHGARLCTDCA